jgi:hypothetical protein
VDINLAGIEKAKQRYQAITDKMNALLAKERSLAGYENAAVQRGQLAVAINQGSIAAEQYHFRVQDIQSDFENRVAPLTSAVDDFWIQCQKLPRDTGNSEWLASCASFKAAVDKSLMKKAALVRAFRDLENFYEQQTAVQADIVSKSQELE